MNARTRRANAQHGRELLAHYDALDRALPSQPCNCNNSQPWPEQPGLCGWCGGTMATAPTLPATIDTEPLQERLEPARRDFDTRLAELRDIDPKDIRANLMGKAAAESAAQIDALAKAFISEAEGQFAEPLERARRTVESIRDLLNRIVAPAKACRDLARPIIAAHAIAVQRKAEDERRELERKQREAAEQERAAQAEALRQEAERNRQEAQQQANAALAAEHELEAQRLAAAAEEAAQAPLAPVAVPLSAVSPAKVEGIGGTFTYIRGIINWKSFSAWLASQPVSCVPGKTRNIVVVKGQGWEATISFAGLRRNDERTAIPGVSVEKTFDPSNRR